MDKMNLKDVNIKGKRVLVRVDFNVPLTTDGKVSDDTRIRAALPTINYLLEQDAKVILMSHLGRPKGKVKPELRLDPVAERLSELIGRKVTKTNDCVGNETQQTVAKMKAGDVVLLENLRFHPEEEANDPDFVDKLSTLADVYVNDAFGTVHRAHASTEGIAHRMPAVSGFLMEKEIYNLGRVLENPEKPFTAILGGAKVSDKIGVIKNLLGKVDNLLIGGGMAFTFLKANGIEIGKSLLEEDKIELAKSLASEAVAQNVNLVIPKDVVVVSEIKPKANYRIVDINSIGKDEIGVDIGPATAEEFKKVIRDSKTVIWNGPMGMFEMKPFDGGTKAVAESMAASNAVTIIGGGDSAAAVEQMGITDKITHVSTGGGASLKFLEGKKLPGVDVLDNRK
jgi:phosphoglycerate kinase